MFDVIFNPKSVAIVGASRSPGKVGYEILARIIRSGFQGRIYPVNPNASEIQGLRCYSSVLDIPEALDLAVIAVPAPIVPQVIEECGKKGVKASIVLSAGFREIGPDGLMAEALIVRLSRKYGMRLLGPNCLGIIDTFTPINASFASQMPRRGNVAFISQSGALATSLLSWAFQEGIGFSTIITLGNRADLDETDFLDYLSKDPHTKAIAIYMEGVKRGEEFRSVASMVSRRKPILILKAGISESGAKAVSSHTGSLAGSEAVYEAVFRSSGILRAKSAEDLFDMIKAFSTQPIPEGRGTFILTNAGGPAILAVDALENFGIGIPSLPSEVVDKLRTNLPAAAGYHNPVDILGDAMADRYAFALKTLLAEDDLKNGIVILTPQAMTQPLETAKVLVEARKSFPGKVILTSFLGGAEVQDAIRLLASEGIPNFSYPERASYALAMLISYMEFLRREPLHPIPSPSVDYEFVKQYLSMVRKEKRVNLVGFEALQIVKAYGIPTVKCGLARSPEEAIQLAEALGYPVVLKVSSPQILHKTDVGGVKLSLESRKDVSEAFESILRSVRRLMPQATIYGIEVHKMAVPGKEVIVGINRDPQFGPVIMFGLGGIYANLLRDVSFRLAPLMAGEALEMIHETKAGMLLRGMRGEKPSDLEALLDILYRTSQLAMDFPEIVEMDLNPVFVYEEGKGCIVVDAKMTIET
ncbi:MAG: acetate--CoA ligase family protein [Candidatus Bathyarchaeia archaeon]